MHTCLASYGQSFNPPGKQTRKPGKESGVPKSAGKLHIRANHPTWWFSYTATRPLKHDEIADTMVVTFGEPTNGSNSRRQYWTRQGG